MDPTSTKPVHQQTTLIAKPWQLDPDRRALGHT